MAKNRKYASYPARSIAYLVDSIWIGVLSFMIDRIVMQGSEIMYAYFELPGANPLALSILSLGVQTGAAFLVLAFSYSIYGTSPGKELLGLKVINAYDGSHLTASQVFFREMIGRPVSSLSFLTMWGWFFLVRQDGRLPHDFFGESAVIQAPTEFQIERQTTLDRAA